MRRVVLTLAGTVMGLVLLLGFKTHPTAVVGAPVPAASAPLPAGASTAPARQRSTGSPSTPAATTRAFTGSVSDTPYGPVQVQITLTAGKITAVNPVQLPNDRQRSVEIASYAVPQLTQETLAAQSAHIDAVSGATYTSEGYVASLQSALDQAGSR